MKYNKIIKRQNTINSKGITLITLVITIILLILLAGISINLVLGENGIFDRAREGILKQKIAEIQDKLELEKAELEVEDKNILDYEKYLEKIKSKGIITDKDIDRNEEREESAEILVEDEYIFLIEKEENGNIKIEYLGEMSTIVNYTITYELNGGSVTNVTSYNIKTNTFTINNPTRNGYTFTGWSGTGIIGKTLTLTIPKGSCGDKIYTANWVQTEVEFAYTGSVQEYKIECTGTYKLVAYGANGGAAYSNQGGGANGQKGSRGNYLEGVVKLNEGDTLYIYVGQGGENAYYYTGSSDAYLGSATFGYGQGGAGYLQATVQNKDGLYGYYSGATGAGGGATAFLLNGTSDSNRLLVAGGGGGAGSWSQTYMDKTGNSPGRKWTECCGFGGQSTPNGAYGKDEKFSGSANDRRLDGGGGGGWTGGNTMKNGTNGVDTTKVTNVVTSTTEINTTSYTFSNYNGSSGLVQADTANGSATLLYLGE